MKKFKLRYVKWWYYLLPGRWKWLRKTEKAMNEPKFVREYEDIMYKQWFDEHPPTITLGKQ